MNKTIIISLVVLAVSISIPSVYAGAGSEYTPTQPNALVSYDSDTNQIQVNWNFNTLPIGTVCLLKGDVEYNENLNEDIGGYDHITSFIPKSYSVTSNSTLAEGSNQSAEKISCTGNMRIDINSIMNHSANINNYPDMQLFLTFYVADPNGDFNSDDNVRIDEVFVLYTPNDIWGDGLKDYACDSQIGNVLYIDQSVKGIHTNNGDNCDQYPYLENNQYLDIGMSNSGNSSGIITYGYHEKSSFSLFIKIGNLETVKKSGGGSCNDCTPPTIGLDNTGKRFVSNGLILNGEIYNVDYYKTHMPMQNTTLGFVNTVILKVYENSGIQNIENIQLGMGVKEIGTPLSESQAIIEVRPDRFANNMETPLLKEVILTDKDNIVGYYNATLSIVPCGVIVSNCLQVMIQWSYDKAPIYDVLMTNLYDYKRNTINDYFNDGLHVEVPYVKKIVEQPYKYECKDPPLDELMNGGTRNNCNFRAQLAMYNQ